MTVDFPSTNDLTWQEWRSNTSAMDSTSNSTDRQSDDQFEPVEADGTLANRFDHASTLPRKACLADITRARVYFMAGAGLIKIGISTNIQSRFRTIRNSSPVPVELLGGFPGTTFFEGMLHAKFAHLRRHGEWFEDTPELRAEIERRLR